MKAGDIIIWRNEKWRVMEVDSDPNCCAWCVNLADPDCDAMIPPHEVEAYVLEVTAAWLPFRPSLTRS